MKKFKNNYAQNIIIIILIIFFFSTKTNFVKNTHFVLLKNYDQRINRIYGFCSPESIGYLRYIKNKHNIKNNHKIVNYEHVPQNNWAIVNTRNIGKINNKIIFLNYPGPQIEYKLTKSNKNIYEFKDVEFFAQHFKSISNIKILSDTNLENKKIKIDIFTLDKSLNKQLFKSIYLEKNKKNINLLFKDLRLSEKKLYFQLDSLSKIKDISITLNNKYDLNNFKIIDEFKNCYYVENL